MAATIGIVACAPHVISVTSRRLGVLREIDRRDDRRAERGRRQVDARDPALGQEPCVLGMGGRRGRVERQVDVGDLGEQVGEAAVGDGVAALARPPQAVGVGIDPRHAHQLEQRAALDLDHQVGADVPGADDRHPDAWAIGAHARVGTRMRRAAWASGTRPKRSSRNGSSSGGRRPVVIISASARPDDGASVTPCIAYPVAM